MTSRTLSLRKELLTELSTDEMRSVAAASGIPCELTRATCIPTENCTGYYPSINAPCTTD